MNAFWVLIASDDPTEYGALEVMLHLEGFRTSHQPTLPGVMLDLSAKPPPDLLVLDARFNENGMRGAMAAIRARRPKLPTIAIADEIDTQRALEVLRAEVDDVLVRPVTAQRLLGTVVVRLARMVTDRRNVVETLTPRELEIAELLAAGGTSRSIGLALGLSHRTVELHRAALHKKLGARNAAEAMAIFQGLKSAQS